MYYKRICSVAEYYEMLCQDNSQYRPKTIKGTRPNPNPRDYRPRNIAYNPMVSGVKAPSDKWGKGLMSSTLSTSSGNAWKNQGNGLMGDTSDAPVIRSAPSRAPTAGSPPVIKAPVISAPVIRAPAISALSAEQQHASERTHRHRTDTTRSNIPIPGSEDESSQDDSDSLFDDQLVPAEKSKILRLRTEIKRIKGGQTYPTGYERDRAREIKKADALRLEGKPIPIYLEGVKPPWIGMGKAYKHYDDNEVAKERGKSKRLRD